MEVYSDHQALNDGFDRMQTLQFTEIFREKKNTIAPS